MSVSVCLSVTEVHWRIIANFGLAVHAGTLRSRCMPGRGEGSSHAMLATARPSCSLFLKNILPQKGNIFCIKFVISMSKSSSLLVRLSPSSVNVYARSPVFIAIVFFL